MIHDWQKLDRSLRGSSIKKGELKFVVLKSRSTGKSMFVQNMMRMRFNSSWTKWEKVWIWKPRVSSRSGKIIWGNVMARENKFMFSAHANKIIQHATQKEALAQQREEFKGILSNG